MPEENARPNAASSTAASDASSAARVGFPVRAYSYPPRSPPTPSCANVELAEIGALTAPVAGSGRNPAWIALVAKPRHLCCSVIIDQGIEARIAARPV